MTGMIWSFAPWMAFLFVVRLGNVYWGAGIGAILAIIVLVRALYHHKAHMFDYIGVIYFVGMLSLLAGLHPSDISTWGRYAQAVAHGSLCVIVFASVLVNRPFTEGYAREQAPKEIWKSPAFRAFNRKISVVWGFAFLLGTLSMALAGVDRFPAAPAPGRRPVRGAGRRIPLQRARGRLGQSGTSSFAVALLLKVPGLLPLEGDPEIGQLDPEGTEPPFVGRAGELSVIAASAQAAMTGRPWLVWVEGVAGSGKTALLRKALAGLPNEFVYVRASGDKAAIDVPYELASQLGSKSRENPFTAGQELLDAWSGHQEQGPAAVVIEDVHWADRASALAVMSAVKRLDRDRVVVIVTSRPSPEEDWDRLVHDEERCRRLSLGSFSAEEVVALAHLNGVELTQRQGDRLWRHTGGHPIWVRTLLTELSPADLRAPDGELPAPRSLASAVTGRISEPPPSARGLAAALAVANQRVPLHVVGRVAEIATPIDALEDLQATGFVRCHPGQPGVPIEFSHPLYRQAVYEDLSPIRRRDLHRSAARVLDARERAGSSSSRHRRSRRRPRRRTGSGSRLRESSRRSARCREEPAVGLRAQRGRRAVRSATLGRFTCTSRRRPVRPGGPTCACGSSNAVTARPETLCWASSTGTVGTPPAPSSGSFGP